MAQFVSFTLVIISVVAWQIFSVGGCPARCVKNGGTCSFLEPTKCCTPICLAQYQVCGKTCAALNAACVLSNDCCSPLACQNNVCCSSVGMTCELNSDCCSNLCNSNKVCCTAGGGTCNLSSDCCSEPCDQATKVCCSALGSTCDLNSFCCSPAKCAVRVNVRICCIPSGLKRVLDLCCSAMFRTDRDAQYCCTVLGKRCSNNFECCERKCVGGFCSL